MVSATAFRGDNATIPADRSEPGRDAAAIDLAGVGKRFGPVEAVRPLDLAIRPGEFLTLLGPSGCGKTTILRMIAGLESVSVGTIRIGGVDMTTVPPRGRDLSIMFQDYALFPHMNLAENVAYGLKMRGVARADRLRRAEGWLDRIGLAGLADRRPDAISGGQRQRVALARALITDPGALLLDEPLSALDANLRAQLRGELRRIHRETRTTFVCVTHDQEEAVTLSDRIAVLSDGQIQQVGPPETLYDAPRTAFVARFFGRCELWPATVTDATAGLCRIDGHAALLRVRGIVQQGERVQLVARPELLSPVDPARADAISGEVQEIIVKGPSVELSVALKAGNVARLELPRHGAAWPAVGEPISIAVSETGLAAVPAPS